MFLLTEMAAKIAPLSALSVPVLGSGFGFRSRKPLSAQAHTPSRPSGASKEQGAKNEGGSEAGGTRPADRANFAAYRHAKTLSARAIRVAKTGEFRVNPEAPGIF